MSAGRPREFDTDAALDKALEVFKKKGFEGTSLPDLTTSMGISRPSLYAAFGNKEMLFQKALDRYNEKMTGYLEEALAAPTAHEAVKRLLTGVIDNNKCKGAKGCLNVQGALVCGDDAESVRQDLAARRARIEWMLRQRFERALAEGDLPTGTSAADLACLVSTVMYGMVVQVNGGVAPDTLRGMVDMTLKAIP
jgi:AcrR family transcriptional regulator